MPVILKKAMANNTTFIAQELHYFSQPFEVSL